MMAADFRGTVDLSPASSDEESSTDYDSTTDEDDKEEIVYESKSSTTENKKVWYKICYKKKKTFGWSGVVERGAHCTHPNIRFVGEGQRDS